MATSYNGWTASPNRADLNLTPLVVAGEPFAPGVRGGDVHTVLGHVAEQLHRRVEPVVKPEWHQADDWGYSFRPNTNNPSSLSCHASATAIDYNATRHPNGKGGTWNAAQKAEILRILAEVNNVVTCLWGYDEMHFEICANAGAVAIAAAKIRNGTVAAGKPAGAQVVGAIRSAYDRVGGAKALGATLGNEVPTHDPRGRWQNFEFGRILWHPGIDNGVAHVLQGDIEQKWKAWGYELTAGWPLTDEGACPDGRGRFNHFSSGASIYWTPQTGAHVVKGDIRKLWTRLGWERGPLGYPKTDETTCPDGVGRFNHFEGGSVYWYPKIGAHPVSGAIRKAWEASGWERGPWGYPVSAEKVEGDVLGQVFQKGRAFVDRAGTVNFSPSV